KLNATLPPAEQIPPIDPMDPSLEKGIAWVDVGKIGYNTSIGSRYLVVKDTFDVVAKVLFDETGGASESVLGDAQKKWFLETMKSSKATWKVWGNEYCLLQIAIDLTQQAAAPAAFQHRYYMNVDAWDGFRNERSALLAELAGIGNVVAITGDIHAFYAGVPATNDDQKKNIVELVTSSISSLTFRGELLAQVDEDPILSQVSAAKLLAAGIDGLTTDKDSKINPALAFADSASNGYAIAEVSDKELVVTFKAIDGKKIGTDLTADPDLAGAFKATRFKTVAGASDLYQEIDGAWKKWDPATLSWT
ncbi:MAG TPA: alkaline phosphatase D family protein, partial [Kofleriaceae bacterium]|nr:alkaline phosphatase D family protein [Kofleriaceae bacterium]